MNNNLKADKLINALRDIEKESRLSIAREMRGRIEKGISESKIQNIVQDLHYESQSTIDGKIEMLLVEGVIDAYFLLDYAKARSEFLRAARLKDSSMSVLGYLFLSDLYENNLFQNEMHSSDENKRISAYYSAVAAVMGSTAGQLRLGDHYRDGYSVPQNPENAKKWYRTAAEGQDTEAEYRLGMVLLQQNNNAAFPHLQKAADCGNSNAQFRMATELLGAKGAIGSRRDKAKGLEYLKKAADQRHAGALDLQYQLNQSTPLPDQQKGKGKGRKTALNFLYLAACITLILIGNYKLTDKIIIRNPKELQAWLAGKTRSESTMKDFSSAQSETLSQLDTGAQTDNTLQSETSALVNSSVQSEAALQSETVMQSETALQSESTTQTVSTVQSETMTQSETAVPQGNAVQSKNADQPTSDVQSEAVSQLETAMQQDTPVQSETIPQSESAAQMETVESQTPETVTPITYDMLSSDPNAYIGANVEFTGKVYYVNEGSQVTEISFNTDWGAMEGTISNDNLSQRVLDDDTIHVLGTFAGAEDDGWGDTNLKMDIQQLEFVNGIQEKTTEGPASYDELMRYPAENIGREVEFTGTVYYVNEESTVTEISFNTDWGTMRGTVSNDALSQKVLEDDTIHVVGTFSGVEDDSWGDSYLTMNIQKLEFVNGVQQKSTEGTASYAELQRYPDENIGREIEFTGEVYYVNEGNSITEISFRTDEGTMEGTISNDNLSQRVLEDDTIHVWGTFAGIKDDSWGDSYLEMDIQKLEFVNGVQEKTTDGVASIDEILRYPTDCVGRQVDFEGSLYYIEGEDIKILSMNVKRPGASNEFDFFSNSYVKVEGSIDKSKLSTEISDDMDVHIKGTFTGLKEPDSWSFDDGDCLCVDIDEISIIS